MPGKKNNITDILVKSDIVFYDYKDKNIPDVIANKKGGRVDLFPWKGKGEEKSAVSFFKTKKLYLYDADVCFLDNKGLRFMLAGFADQCHYIFLRIFPRPSWFLALPGLIRRMVKGQVILRNIMILGAGGKKQAWLVVENMDLKFVSGGRGYLSEAIGVQGFLDFLRKENIKYVVLRFYEKLPQLYREGGDIDILVDDEDEIKMQGFLKNNPGKIRVDIWSVSRPNYRQMAYYPPPFARRIIDGAVDGPAGSRVPGPKEYFLSLAYHALYHKGLDSGIPSSMLGIKMNPKPDNDYRGVLSDMAKKTGIDIAITMESLDEYLCQEGWRPKIDTLSRFASENEWVLKRFFSNKNQEEIGLGFFIFKKRAVDLDLVGKMIKMILKEHFIVIEKKYFNQKEQIHVAEQLRGGFWSSGKGPSKDFFPAAGVLVIDALPGKDRNYSDEARIRRMKEKLRVSFDSEKESVIHATDNTRESWEYINVCFPDKINEIKEKIKKAKPAYYGFSHYIKKKMIIYQIKIYYYKKMAIIKIREFLMDLVIS